MSRCSCCACADCIMHETRTMPRKQIQRGDLPLRSSPKGTGAIDPLDPMQGMPSGELLALAGLAEPEIIRRLNAVGERFGKVRNVLLLPKLADTGRRQLTFLVNFESALDASRAGRAMNCPLYGYTTIIVSLPQQAGARETQSRPSALAETRTAL